MAAFEEVPRSIKRLRTTEETSVFESALDCLPDGVLIMRDDGTLVYANAACGKTWSVSEELLRVGDETALAARAMHLLVDPVQLMSEPERLRNTQETSEDELLFKDGRIVSRRSVPFEKGTGLEGRIWIFKDVTEARRAAVDDLTGLPNRHAYVRDYARAVMAHHDDGWFRSVGIMDVDNFKRYNDIYGHAAGDTLLRQLGALLREAVSNPGDLIFRIGGEEFLIFVRSERHVTITTFFEELRTRVQMATIEHAGNLPYAVATASFGVAVFKGAGDPEKVFRRADMALYCSKSAGKNKVTLAAEEMPAPAAE
ncbi:sensor domain-containing diguanylate cyclase [Lichenifustis flavocetrariae]|uniref:diguanylate cyclase n=1 Tax=Lichenifustis flavocetrariae TaxID=2949735 RepID=A0AA41Z720_9HYPH|nr:sensor domain-containing diguanylate cyclase [Lichenifustis flavocetrariae]MCW6510437.1 sensor domain-containing diguanylate cyclase [Lichenifustis flavocetrariae]